MNTSQGSQNVGPVQISAPARKPPHLFKGILMLLLGGTLSMLMTHSASLLIRRHGFRDFWTIGGMAVIALMGAFWIWAGSDELRRAGGAVVNKPKFRWGRLLTGISFVFFALKGHFAPGPNSFKADNEAQAAGMMFATVILVGIGLAFIAFAFKPRKPEAPAAALPGASAVGHGN